MSATEATKSETGPNKGGGSGTLALLSVAQLVVVLDFSIVQVALPTIRSQLGISIADSQWIVSAYGLTFAGLLLLSGRVSDLYGRRRLFAVGLVIFALASLAAGLAPSEAVVISARAVQGVGAAIASATSLSLVVVSFAEGPARNRALSAFSAVSSAGFAVGVVLGGVLTASVGWRWIFFINVPIGIVAALLASRFVGESRGDSTKRQLDIPGAVAVTAGLSLLVYALTEAANTSLFSVNTLSLLSISALVLIGFFVIERKSNNPLVPLSFLRRRTAFAANGIAVLLVSTVSSMIFLLTIFLQQIQGYSPLSAGLVFLPTGVVWLVVSGFLSAKFVGRFGIRQVMVWSMVVLGIGFLLLSRITVASPLFSYVLPSLLVAAAGSGFGYTAFYIAALSGAEHGEEGLASGVVNTSIQVGGPIGLAISVTIASVVAASVVGKLGVEAATVAGFGDAFLGDIALAATGVVLAAVLLPRPKIPAVQVSAQTAVQEPAVQPPKPVPISAGAVVEGGAMAIRKILVAVDGSENGRRAAQTAIKLAGDYKAQLIFLRVVTTPKTPIPAGYRGGTGGSLVLNELYDSAEKEAENYVASLVREATDSGVVSATGVVLRATSSPASAIVDKAASEGVDVIVVGTRGLDPPKRLFVGSVSSGVVAGSEIQVLVVK